VFLQFVRFNKKDRIFQHRIKQILFVKPKNLHFFRIALSHKTKPYYFNKKAYNNEILEFLGDAVINLVVADYLRKKYPDKKEGELSQMRSNLVSRKTLNKIASRLNLSKVILKSKDTFIYYNVLGNALEAIFGAFFLDGGYENVEKFFLKLIENNVITEKDYFYNKNYKSILLAKGDKERFSIEFFSERIDITDNKFYKSYTFVNNILCGEGMDKTKKNAEQIASLRTLKILKQYDTYYINIGNKRNNRR